ncbi:MAG: hypothetical protein JNM94_17720 [Phycisphaerae bacterium]|nr:hypothetical protein [Phycisphaerae bacterium]
MTTDDSFDQKPETPRDPEAPAPAPAPEPATPTPLDIDLAPEPEEAPRVTPKVERSATADASAKAASTAAAADVVRPLRPIVRGTHYEWVLAVAGCGAAVLLGAALAGQRGVMPFFNADGTPADPAIVDRIFHSLKLLLRIALGSSCLVAGAYFLQLLDRRPVGDLRVLASRMLAITALALLATLLPIEHRLLKQIYDVLVPLVAIWALMMLFFRVKPRDAGIILFGGLVALTILSLGSQIVAFAVT